MVNLLVKYNWQHRRFELLYSAYGNQRDTQRNTTSSYFLNQLFVFLIYNLTQNSNKKYWIVQLFLSQLPLKSWYVGKDYCVTLGSSHKIDLFVF